MTLKAFFLLLLGITVLDVFSQSQNNNPSFLSLEPSLHIGKIVKNSSLAPSSKLSVLSEMNFSIQTSGKDDWNTLYGFPKVGVSIFYGSMGNKREIGNMFGLLPNITFNSINPHWYAPRINLGLGIAYFNNPYNPVKNTSNLYIGSALTAFGYASVYIKPRINDHLWVKAGISVMHCSNGHVQIPNLGINLPCIFAGIVYSPFSLPKEFIKKEIYVSPSTIHFNLRIGVGVHQLAKTTEPIGTPKYAIYIIDLYASKRFGKINNLQLGLSLNHYKSFLNYIEKTNLFASNRMLKATVATLFVGHELMIHKFSLLSQGGINIYNPFYKEWIKQFDNMQGFSNELKKYISTRLGLQYYLRDPKYCTRSNIFLGAYIKANFGQADFICAQIGFVL
jgi:hypothetical protein